MSDIISCPGCRRKLQAPDNLIGQDVQCPTCGVAFIATPQSPLVYPFPPERPRPRPQPPRPRPDRDDCPYAEYADKPARPRRFPRAPHRGSAILTLGILSLTICLTSLVLGPLAWAMGQSDMNEIRAGRMDPAGEGSTNAGRICGMIATILGASVLGVYLLFFVLFGALVAAIP